MEREKGIFVKRRVFVKTTFLRFVCLIWNGFYVCCVFLESLARRAKESNKGKD